MLTCILGTFDGVHRGHQSLVQQATDLGPVHVITFDPHPLEVLKNQAPLQLCSLSQRQLYLRKAGAHTVEVIPFTPALAALDAEAFLRQIHHRIGFSRLIMGPDARLGAGGRGNFQEVQRIGSVLGFELQPAQPSYDQGELISSSRIRSRLESGDLPTVNRLLGRPWEFEGRVISGAGRGQKLGFPTANLVTKGWILPPLGVYAVEVQIENRWIPGVANLGPAPTFDREECVLEVHLLEWNGSSLLHQPLSIRWHDRLRGQQKFASLEALCVQLQDDKKNALKKLTLSQNS